MTNEAEIKSCNDKTSSQDPFNVKDRVQILLAEYNSLRSETIHRVNNVYQLVAISAVTLIWFLGRQFDGRYWVGLLVCSAALCFYTFDVTRNIMMTAKRVREIEKDINQRVGERLLEWETSWGGGLFRIDKKKQP